MMMQTSSELRERRGAGAGMVLLAILLGVLVGIGGLAILARQATTSVWSSIATKITGRPVSVISQPTVVAQIQRLERLETVTYTMDKVVEGDRSSEILPDFLVGDKLLLLVHGQAIAGVDLSQLKSSDVVVNGKSVDVHLPEAEVFVTALDDSQTRVYSRNTGWFVQADPNLESQVRAKAEKELHDSALTAGILATAHTNAVATLTRLLMSLGFEQVHIS
jgi:hypothetical protein